MPKLEVDKNGNLKPPIDLEMANDTPTEKTPTTCFEWDDAVGNKVKKDVPVFRTGIMKTFLKWQDTINSVIKEQKLSTAIAEYYVFVTKKIVKLELKGHCEHLPSSHCDFYVSHCYGGCGHALRCADHQGRPYVPRKR